MRLIPLALAFAAAASLASCGGSTDPVPLRPEQQQARLHACMQRMAHYQQLGVWKHGGAKPGVARATWDALTDAEKNEVFDLAGCISAGGQVGERIVTVAEEGGGAEIETRRVANDRDFAAELK